MTGYEKYSDSELLESYTSAIDHATPVDPKLKEEIQNRGGLDHIKKKVAEERIIPDEEKRIRKETWVLASEGNDIAQIHKRIHSKILSNILVHDLIEKEYVVYKNRKEDLRISRKTILQSLLGCVVAIIVNLYVITSLFSFLGEFNIISFIIIQFLNLAIMWLFTGKSRKNAMVFICSFAATFLTFLILFIWAYNR